MKTLPPALVILLALPLAPHTPTRAEPLREIKIVNDRTPDCSSLEAIVNTVTRDCRTDDQRAIALYNFCRYVYYHHAYPNEPGGISALKLINVYGWALCGGQHTVMAALWEKAGYKWRYRGWSAPGHTTVEVFYNGRWHYLDTFLKFYAWTPDPQTAGGRTIASQEDIRTNPSLVTDGFSTDETRKVCYHADDRFAEIGDQVNWTAPAFLVCGDALPDVLSGIRSSNNAGSPRGWGGIQFDDPNYSTAINLGVGYTLTLDWDKMAGAFFFPGSKDGPGHSCGDKEYRNCPAIGPLLEPYRAAGPARTWSNGTLVFKPDFTNNAFLASLRQAENAVWRDGRLWPQDAGRPGMVVIEMSSPYVATKASGRISGEGVKTEVSHDLKSWTAVDLADFTAAVVGKYGYFVRLTFARPIAGIELTSILQHNQYAVPYLAPGRNVITVSAADGQAFGNNRLVVTYAYCPGWRDKTPAQILAEDAEIARAHFATWSATPVVVQKVIQKFPATFEVLVPTPKGKQPVYPRMLFLRREVLAAGQQPAAVPAPPSTPTVGPDEVLATLPDPWLIGTQKPPVPPARPTTKAVLPAAHTLYVSKQGEVFEHSFIKWLKDDTNAWVLLADFDPAKLPDAAAIASAQLVVYAIEAHDKAPAQVAAVALDAPFEPGKPYDFAKLGKTAGTTVVQQGNGPGAPFVPPRRYEIDMTKAVRAWARGEKPPALAVRIVPNRGVDDGWTVRFTPPKERPVELQVVTYVDGAAGK